MYRIKYCLLIVAAYSIFGTAITFGQTDKHANIPREVVIDYTKQFWITSEFALGEKFLIKIFLPKSYFDSDTTYYPVLYLTDADAIWGAATDFPYFLHQDNPSIIIVGIAYGSYEEGFEKYKRGLDLSTEPNQEGKVGAEYFLKFLNEELLPKVESKYRVDTSNRTLYGLSLGGVFALYVLFKQPGFFKNVITAGVPFWALSMEDEYSKNHNDLPVRLYMGVGEYDVIAYPHFLDFTNRVTERGYKNLKFKWEILPKLEHEYLAAIVSLCRGLQYVFFPQSIRDVMLESIKRDGIEKAIAKYYELKRTEADDYNFAESELYEAGYLLLESERIKEAIQICKLNVEAYPESWKAYDRLALAYMKNGDKELAIANYKKSRELNLDNTNAVEMLKQLENNLND